MLSVELIDRIPDDLRLADWSQQEFDRTSAKDRTALVQVSPHVWQLSRDGETLILAGVSWPMAVGTTPELWLLVGDALKKKLRRNVEDLRGAVRALLKLYPHVLIRVDANYPTGQRFAEFMGFKRLRGRSEFRDREYLVYEVREGDY